MDLKETVTQLSKTRMRWLNAARWLHMTSHWLTCISYSAYRRMPVTIPYGADYLTL